MGMQGDSIRRDIKSLYEVADKIITLPMPDYSRFAVDYNRRRIQKRPHFWISHDDLNVEEPEPGVLRFDIKDPICMRNKHFRRFLEEMDIGRFSEIIEVESRLRQDCVKALSAMDSGLFHGRLSEGCFIRAFEAVSSYAGLALDLYASRKLEKGKMGLAEYMAKIIAKNYHLLPEREQDMMATNDLLAIFNPGVRFHHTDIYLGLVRLAERLLDNGHLAGDDLTGFIENLGYLTANDLIPGYLECPDNVLKEAQKISGLSPCLDYKQTRYEYWLSELCNGLARKRTLEKISGNESRLSNKEKDFLMVLSEFVNSLIIQDDQNRRFRTRLYKNTRKLICSSGLSLKKSSLDDIKSMLGEKNGR